jgi:hypothetical protein
VVQPLLAARNYTEALSKLAALRAPIDAFFEGVMVMADDAELKANRLRLLAQLRDLFTRDCRCKCIAGLKSYFLKLKPRYNSGVFYFIKSENYHKHKKH